MEDQQLVIYTSPEGAIELKIQLKEESLWMTQAQLATLYDKDRDTISEHIVNIYNEQELLKEGTARKFRVVQKEGSKDVNRELEHYSLDMIIAVGYRVSSKKATQFRIWATKILHNYLVKGYAFNQSRIQESQQILHEIQTTLQFITSKRAHEEITGHEHQILGLIQQYAFALSQMLAFDEKKIEVAVADTNVQAELTMPIVRNLIKQARAELGQRGEANSLFGSEVGQKFEGIIGAIHQTYAGEYLYPSIDEMAANLLYLVIKDHPFADGNKRIGSLLFVYFLQLNHALRKIDDNTLLSLALLVAVSDPKEKEIMIKLIRNIVMNGKPESI